MVLHSPLEWGGGAGAGTSRDERERKGGRERVRGKEREGERCVHVHAFSVAFIQVEGLKMVVSNSTNLASCRSSFLSAMGQGVLISKEQTSSHDNVAEMISDLKVHCISAKLHGIIRMPFICTQNAHTEF